MGPARRHSDETALLAAFGDRLSPGDIVLVGKNARPLYQVMAVHDDTAWVRGLVQGADFVVQGSDYLVPVERCRRISPASTDTLH
jgi:hypothetical protein